MKKLNKSKIQTNIFVFWGLVFLSFISLILGYREISRHAACLELLDHNTKNYRLVTPSNFGVKPQDGFRATLDVDYIKKENEAFQKYEIMSKKSRLSLDERDRDKFRRRALKRKLWGKTCPQIDFSYLRQELRQIELERSTK